MTESNKSETGNMKESPLPRRDWVLLPLLGLATMILLIVGMEWIARVEFRDAETGLAPCLVLNDNTTGVRGVPNSTCWAKSKESAWIEYRFNSWGHRAGMEGEPRNPGSYRIVMTGSSVAMGLFVPREKSIAGLLPGELTRLSGRKVEVYNTSIGAAYGGTPHSIAQRFNEILAARPDMVLWVLTPWDLDHASDLHPQDIYLRAEAKGETAQSVPPKISASPLHRVAAAVGMESAMTFLYDGLKSFRFRTLLSHYLFESRSMYVNSYLKNDDEMVGFLKSDWGPGWKDRINEFDVYAAEIENRSAAAGIPLVAVLVPNRAQAAMISMGTWPQGYDPYKIDYELQSVITRHGGTYIDIFPPFRTIPNPEDHYMPVDGHPDAEGHAMISNLIANVLTRGAVPAIRAASGPDGALETMK